MLRTRTVLKQIKELVKQGKVCDSLDYSKDRKLKRLVYLKLRDINLFRKYKKYMKYAAIPGSFRRKRKASSGKDRGLVSFSALIMISTCLA